ncbi:metallophosphoesterase [Candidatus Bathyarchaeota archaeon]|nr:metallophosphoesterase [Candidatus Bathyarchaeota archaeon]
MNHRRLVLLSVIVVSLLAPIVIAQSVTIINKPISRPLPTLPSPVLAGGTLRVEIDANQPQGVSASLISAYEEASLTLASGPTEEGALWALIFNVPDVTPGLYDLHIAFSGNEYVQPRSVWVMDEWPSTLTISQISDIHQPYGGVNFTQFIYEQNLLNPDLILGTGDIVDVETIRAAWENLQGTMQYSRVPIYLLAGNHDHTEDAKYYRQYGGKTNYTITIGDFFIVGLNSDGGGYITLDELAWADKVLGENPDKVKIIAFHHPLLSSEYEDDMGTMAGGEITGNWQNAEALEPYMYFTWSQNLDNAQELLKVIQENDVRVILSGHVHRDMVYILNGENYFITTTTLGGSSSQSKGYREITITSSGTVTLDPYGETNKFNPPNTIPLDHVNYLYKQANDGTGTAVSAIVENSLNMVLNDARLEFIVDSSLDTSAYTITPIPDSQEIKTTADGHHFIAYYDIPAETTFTATIYAEQDITAPDVEIVLAELLDGSGDVSAAIDVTDVGWGVKTTTVSYSTDGTTWTPIPLSLKPTISLAEWTISLTKDHYFTPPIEQGDITFKVESTDFAGNTAAEQSKYTATEPEPEPEPANIIYKTITATPTTIETGGQVTITVTLENTGGLSGTETIELLINDQQVDTETVAVTGGATESASFTYTATAAGTYTVKAATKTATFTATAPEQEPSGGIPLPATYAMIGVLGAAYLVSRRRH